MIGTKKGNNLFIFHLFDLEIRVLIENLKYRHSFGF